LVNHPAWPALRKVTKARKQQHFDDVAKALMQGKEVPQDVLEWKRGFFKGMEYVLEHPAHRANELERALRNREDVTLDA
jgi:hypothetical protein